jgi:uncharacterized protein (TIGR00369 family)
VNLSWLYEHLSTIPIFKTLQFRASLVGDGEVSLTAPYDPRFDNVFNCAHGGILTTVADSAAYVAVLVRAGRDVAITTTDLTIRFLAPCRSNITATARIIKFGRTLCPVAVDLHDAHGVLVAVAQVTYLRMEHDKKLAESPNNSEKGRKE